MWVMDPHSAVTWTCENGAVVTQWFTESMAIIEKKQQCLANLAGRVVFTVPDLEKSLSSFPCRSGLGRLTVSRPALSLNPHPVGLGFKSLSNE